MVSAFLNCFKIPELRQRLLFTLALLVIVRLGAAIPCPGINPAVLAEYFKSIVDQGGQGDLIGMVNLFSGGALENCAIFSLTIMPYISASIIMQLAVGVIPSLAKTAREEGGRQKVSQYTRIGTLILCVIQGYLLAVSFESPERIQLLGGIDQIIAKMGPLVADPGWFFRFTTVVTLTAGTMLLMWLGEQITDKGIGNGISLVITVGIVARLPAALATMWDKIHPPAGQSGMSPLVVVLLLAFLFLVIAGTVMITQAMRKVPVQYARQVRGNKVYGGQSSFLPLKVNYSGVMPIIFASSIITFPAVFLGLMFRDNKFAAWIQANLGSHGLLYQILYASMIFFFSYFWVAMVFNPTQIADDMKKHGGFIPGVRPGTSTAQFLDFSMTRLTFAGAVFLTILAVLPSIISGAMKVPWVTASFFGGTSLLILVGVMLDTMRQMETYLLQRHYDGFLKKGKLRGRSFGGQGAAGEALSEKKMFWLLFIVGVIFIGGVVASLILHR
ncbi:MAG: preprotein translocase subunit SecY [Verrucomicrobiales bacterium]|jgi:preprotein translocase subunit SecY|nr:preprotein translocase subunit SecY [Verrucomicrobiales bacterium]